jgi:hypothetical protein
LGDEALYKGKKYPNVLEVSLHVTFFGIYNKKLAVGPPKHETIIFLTRSDIQKIL